MSRQPERKAIDTRLAQPTPPKRGRGQPRRFATRDDLQTAIDGYFSRQDAHKPEPDPYTIEGLTVYLDITREELHAWETGEWCPEYSDTVKKAKDRIRENIITRIARGQNNVAGPIFYAKAALGYREINTVEIVDHTLETMTDAQLAKIASKGDTRGSR